MADVSIIIPTNNSERFVSKLSSSILGQTYKNFEVIVVDNNSKDNTLSKLKRENKSDSRFKYYKIDNEGIIAKSRNFGVINSTGKYIAFLDSDDYWHKEKLKNSLKYLPQYDFVYHLMKIKCNNNFIYNNKILFSYQLSKNSFIDLMTFGNPISTSSVILKKSLITKREFFSENSKNYTIEDFDCWINLSKQEIKFKLINKVLGFYSMNVESSSSLLKKNSLSSYKINHIYLKNKNLIKNKKEKEISKHHFRYLMANNSLRYKYKLLVYKSLLFKFTPKISKLKLLIKIFFYQIIKND